MTAITVVVLEGGASFILYALLGTADPSKVKLFHRVFARHGATFEGREGETLLYRPHPYLGFAINPDAAYMGEQQFNGDYLIRRRVPPAPRDKVRLRILAIGGSTTFGAGVAREDETWVSVLERELRRRLEPSTEVINGGVGGYNVIENMIHYSLLLSRLEPDLVLLVVGVNDVHPRLIGTLRPDYSNSRLVWNGDGIGAIRPISALRWSRLYRLVIWSRINRGQVGHIYSVVQRPYPPLEEWPHKLSRNGPEVFERHLRSFVRLLLAERRRVAIVPQLWLPRPNNKADLYFGIGVSQHNDVARRVAMETGIPFLAEAADKRLFSRRDLWDAVHFNERGSRVMASILAQWITSHSAELFPVLSESVGRRAYASGAKGR